MRERLPCTKCGSVMAELELKVPERITIAIASIDLRRFLPGWIYGLKPYRCEKCGYLEFYVKGA